MADSGSGAHTLVGAVSFGIGCARVGSLYSLQSSKSKFPALALDDIVYYKVLNQDFQEGLYGVYADVPFFRTWIDETIAAKGGATFCS